MNLEIILLLILENHMSIQTVPDWVNTTKALKEKVRSLYGKVTKPTDVSVSVGPRPFGDLDYPGNDRQRLEIIERIWNQYYQCLRIKQKSVGSSKSMPPYTVAVFVETSVDLSCNVCISPEDAIENMEWFFVGKPYNGTPVQLEEDESRQISAYTFTLKIFIVKISHEGMYYCQLRNDKDAPHFLHVLSTRVEPFIEVKPPTSRQGPHMMDPNKIPGSNVVVWHDWTEWTDCSYCDKVGLRSKVGYFVDPLVSKSDLPTRTELIEVEALLKTFVYGIPCRSRLLPNDFTQSEFIKNQPTQVLTAFCKVSKLFDLHLSVPAGCGFDRRCIMMLTKDPHCGMSVIISAGNVVFVYQNFLLVSCPADTIVEVLDPNGNIIDRYNNSAGEYYHSQDLPPLPIGPQRVTYYADLGKPFVIPCPNKYRTNTPIDWSVGGKIWLKKNVEDVSHGRITLNNLNQIVFHRVEEMDKKIYTCWQHREIVGVVRLLFNRAPTYFEEYLATVKLYPFVMIISIIIVFSLVSLKMCLNREKARIGAIVVAPTRKKSSRNIRLADDPASLPESSGIPTKPIISKT